MYAMLSHRVPQLPPPEPSLIPHCLMTRTTKTSFVTTLSRRRRGCNVGNLHPLANEEQASLLALFEMVCQQPNTACALEEVNEALLARGLEISMERATEERAARTIARLVPHVSQLAASKLGFSLSQIKFMSKSFEFIIYNKL
jgi:hypothetical protein